MKMTPRKSTQLYHNDDHQSPHNSAWIIHVYSSLWYSCVDKTRMLNISRWTQKHCFLRGPKVHTAIAQRWPPTSFFYKTESPHNSPDLSTLVIVVWTKGPHRKENVWGSCKTRIKQECWSYLWRWTHKLCFLPKVHTTLTQRWELSNTIVI